MGKVISSREFNQNPSEAKRAAAGGPVIVTDRGEPAFVLLNYDAYRRLTGDGEGCLLDLLRDDGAAGDFDFEPPRLADDFPRPASFD